MKKYVLVCLLFTVALMSACADNLSPVSNDSSSEQKEEKVDSETKKDIIEQEQKKEEAEKQEVPVSTVEKPGPKYTVNQRNWLVEPMDESINDKVVLLTIDDAPDKYAGDMAKTLKELDADAIFFVNGHFLETPEGKESLKKIHDMGFLIGNHTYSHANLPDLSKGEQRKEIVQVSDMVEEVIGEKPLFFRAPNGANTDYTKKIAAEEDMILMNWFYGYDWKKEYMSKEAITDIMLHTDLLVDGANLLMHDREWTSQALHDIVIGLRDQGYEIVDPHLIKTK